MSDSKERGRGWVLMVDCEFEFHGSSGASEAGFFLHRHPDDAVGLAEIAGDVLTDTCREKDGRPRAGLTEAQRLTLQAARNKQVNALIERPAAAWPGHAEMHNGLGLALAAARRSAEGAEACRAARAIAPVAKPHRGAHR